MAYLSLETEKLRPLFIHYRQVLCTAANFSKPRPLQQHSYRLRLQLHFHKHQKALPPQTVKAVRDRIKPITKEERLARQDKARELMARLGIDALFFEGGTSLNYFTGISWGRSERLFTMILPRNGEPQYVAPKFEADRATEQVGKAKLLTWEEDESPYEFIKQILKEKNIPTGTPGIEETTRFFVTDRITKEIGTTKLVNGKPDDW